MNYVSLKSIFVYVQNCILYHTQKLKNILLPPSDVEVVYVFYSILMAV